MKNVDNRAWHRGIHDRLAVITSPHCAASGQPCRLFQYLPLDKTAGSDRGAYREAYIITISRDH